MANKNFKYCFWMVKYCFQGFFYTFIAFLRAIGALLHQWLTFAQQKTGINHFFHNKVEIYVCLTD